MRFPVLTLALVVAGCAAPEPLRFASATATKAESDRAHAKCDYQVSAATQAPDYGFRTVFGQELDRAMRQRDLMIKCMAAEGFILLPKP